MKSFQNYLEKFPKLLGNIEEAEISTKFWKQFMVVLEILTDPIIFPGSFGKSSRKIHGSYAKISKTFNHRLDSLKVS
jgi:hypothetical protein